MSIEAMKQALEALENPWSAGPEGVADAIDALRAAIAEAEKQEPVAWMVYTLDGQSVCVTDNPADFTDKHRALPLYTAPRQWVGLTDEEKYQLVLDDPIDWIEAVEEKLKEKNRE